MSQEDRRDFSEDQVDLVYKIQGGCCHSCGASLDQTGYHRHHIDKNHHNNTIDNLWLDCPRCHHAKTGLSNPYTDHKKQEAIVLKKLNEVLDLMIEPKIIDLVDAKGAKSTKVLELSGVVLEKVVDGLTMSLKVSRNLTDVDYGKEYTPTAIRIQRKMMEAQVLGETWIEGYMQAVKDTLSKIKIEVKE